MQKLYAIKATRALISFENPLCNKGDICIYFLGENHFVIKAISAFISWGKTPTPSQQGSERILLSQKKEFSLFFARRWAFSFAKT